MMSADKGTAELLDGSKLHIGIVQARFNEGVTNTLLEACRSELLALGVPECHISLVRVPGALRCRWRCRRWPSAASATH